MNGSYFEEAITLYNQARQGTNSKTNYEKAAQLLRQIMPESLSAEDLDIYQTFSAVLTAKGYPV